MNLPDSFVTCDEFSKSTKVHVPVSASTHSDRIKFQFDIPDKTTRILNLMMPDLVSALRELAEHHPETALMFAELTKQAIEAGQRRTA